MDTSTILIIIGVVLLAASAILIPSGFYLKSRPKLLLTGRLETLTVNPKKNFTVSVGSNLLVTDYPSLVNGLDMRRFINYGHEYPIKITVDQGRLLLSADIYGRDGVRIAWIVDNEWGVNPQNRFDRNFSNTKFEAVDNEEDRMPVLQVEILSGNFVRIGGVFYYPTGKVVVTADAMYINPSSAVKPKRIFRYPSNNHLGVLNIAN